jgi:ribosomal-protein-alanine N-acetyltransferase
VRESNISAQKLYEKHGFVQNGLRKNYYHNPTENAVLMAKELIF